jgi:hypothetical protein
MVGQEIVRGAQPERIVQIALRDPELFVAVMGMQRD